MTENRLDVIAEHLINHATAGLDTARALGRTQRKLEKAENHLATLEAAYLRLADLVAEQRDRIEKLEKRERK